MSLVSDEFQEFLEEIPSQNNPEVENAIRVLMNFASKEGQESLKEKFEEIIGPDGDKFISNLAKDLAEISGLSVKEHSESFRQIWQRTMAPVWKNAKESFLSKDGFRIIGASLSLAGKTWEGLSEFWEESQKEHPLLKYADKPAKAFAVALYVKGAPVIGAIKAAELVGRTAEEYGKSRKLWPSIKKASKDTAKSIYKHFLRLTIGQEAHPAMEEFYKRLGIEQDNAKNFVKAVEAYDQLGQISDLGISGARHAAMHVTKITEEIAKRNTDTAEKASDLIDVGLISSIVIPSTLKGLSHDKMLEIASATIKPDIAEKLSHFPPSIKSFTMDRITQYALDNPSKNIEEVMSKSLDALHGSKNPDIGVNAFGHYLKKQKPELYIKLVSFFGNKRGDVVSIEDAEAIFKDSKPYKKLKKSEKMEFQKYFADYAVEDILQGVLETSADRAPRISSGNAQNKPTIRQRFSKFFTRKKKDSFAKSLIESREEKAKDTTTAKNK